MRKISTLATALVMSAAALQAQTVAHFDTLQLVGADTFYVNYSKPGNDVGFVDGMAHFESVFDTVTYKSLRKGFVYSNMTDTVTSGFTNPNSAKAGSGYGGSKQYAVGFGFEEPIFVRLTGDARGKIVKGFYVTNNTYAYNSMRDGDFAGKKFGGVPNVDTDWFKLTVKGYMNNIQTADSVDFYLADFRDADSTKDYILKTWEWVDLTPLGKVDSLTFITSSSDVGQFGTNTPMYFCMDNLETGYIPEGVEAVPAYVAKVYPNPATDKLFVEVNDASIKEITVASISGSVVARFNATDKVTRINTANFTPGIYLVQMTGTNGTASVRFVKQ